MINLIFDVDDTLYDQLKPFKDAFEKVFSEYKDIPCMELYKKSRKYSDDVFEQTEKGLLSLEDMHVYRISKAFYDYGVEIERTKALEFQKEYASNQGKISISDGMINVLDFGKKNNITLGIITNGPTEHQTKKIKALGLEKWIDNKNIFISESMNMSKPDIRAFKFVEDKMNIEPDCTYYVGDSLKNDVVGAKSAGWKMIWINRRNHIIPKDLEYYPDYIIKDDKELVPLLKNILDLE